MPYILVAGIVIFAFLAFLFPGIVLVPLVLVRSLPDWAWLAFLGGGLAMLIARASQSGDHRP